MSMTPNDASRIFADATTRKEGAPPHPRFSEAVAVLYAAGTTDVMRFVQNAENYMSERVRFAMCFFNTALAKLTQDAASTFTLDGDVGQLRRIAESSRLTLRLVDTPSTSKGVEIICDLADTLARLVEAEHVRRLTAGDATEGLFERYAQDIPGERQTPGS